VKIVSVEAEEGGRLFVSAKASPGATVRLYLNDTLVAPGGAAGDGRVSFAIGRGVRPGGYRVRIDDVDPVSGAVKSRAEVEFKVPAPLTVEARPPAGPPAAATASAALPPAASGAPVAQLGEAAALPWPGLPPPAPAAPPSLPPSALAPPRADPPAAAGATTTPGAERPAIAARSPSGAATPARPGSAEPSSPPPRGPAPPGARARLHPIRRCWGSFRSRRPASRLHRTRPEARLSRPTRSPGSRPGSEPRRRIFRPDRATAIRGWS
jgi:hypothetical protein